MTEQDSGTAHPFRLRWYPRAALSVIGVVIVVLTLSSDGVRTVSGRVGGDFPSFYAAGSIVADGRSDSLYDPETQAEAQAELLGDEDGFLYFAYPPFFAVPYAGLSAAGYRTAFLIHTALMFALLWGAVRLVRPFLPGLIRSTDHEVAVVAASLAFYPLLRAMLGGQNTALTLFVVAATWRLASDGRDLSAGLVLAALLYKPQFGVVLLVLVLFGRRWRVGLGWGLGAAGLYAAGVLVSGWGWVGGWLDQVRSFDESNIEANGDLMVSAVGFFRNIWGSAPGAVLAAVIVVGVALVLVVPTWLRRPLGDKAMGLAGPVVVIAALSALYYDAALALVTLGVALSVLGAGAVAPVALFFVGSWSQLAAGALGFSPVFLLLLGILWWGRVRLPGERG